MVHVIGVATIFFLWILIDKDPGVLILLRIFFLSAKNELIIYTLSMQRVRFDLFWVNQYLLLAWKYLWNIGNLFLPDSSGSFKSQLIKFEELPLSFPATSVAYIINFFRVRTGRELELEKLLQPNPLCLSLSLSLSRFYKVQLFPESAPRKTETNFKL